jgi:hypothetical protein
VSFFVGSRYLRLERATVHPLMAIVIPLLSLLSLDPLARALAPFLPSPPVLIYPFLLVTALEEAVMGNILFKERASLWARLRELLLVLIAALLCLFLAERSMHWKVLYPLALVLVQWLSSAAIHSNLREREILLSALAGKREGALAHELRDSSLQAAVALRSMNNVKGLVLFYQGFLFCLLLAAAIRGVALGPWIRWAAFLQAVCGLSCLGVINLFIENQLLLGEGIAVPLQAEKRRALFLLSLMIVAVLLVFLAKRETSLLPLSVLLGFLKWLVSLFRIKADPRWVQWLQTVAEERRRYYELLLSLRPSPSGPAYLLLLLILEILRRVLITAVAVALFLFLTAPLFSDSFMQSLRELRPFAFLRRKLRAFAFACLRLLRALLNWWRSLGREKRVLSAERTPLRGKHRGSRHEQRIGLRKRAQMSRVLKAFLRLLKWGERKGVRYFPSNAPREYALRLEAAIPGSVSTITPVIEILEEVLFSPRLVAAQRLDRYFRLIRSLPRLRQ